MNTQPRCPQCQTILPAGALEGLCPACLLKQGATTEPGLEMESAQSQSLSLPEVGRLFPQLEIVELIGKGGMGTIYKARQPALDRLVALKLLPGDKAGGAKFAERFNREARALARLSHPSIVTVHEFGHVEGLHYFIMEYVDGVNLRQLEKAGRLSSREALQIIPQICDALQYAHDEGVVHRDIKPENILIDRKGRVKIADFGLAKILGQNPETARLTREGHVMGTPHYMAPEQVEHPLQVDHRADIYALGVVFYEMLTGELPLGKFAPPSRKVEVDVRLDEVVLRALEKEPDLRYQQASQIKSAVETISHPPQPNPAAASGSVPASGATQRSIWSRLQFRFWPPLVGRRDGQRVVNWPAVLMRGARSIVAAVGFGLAVGMALGSLWGPRVGLLAGGGEMLLILLLAPALLVIRTLRGFAIPLDLLPELAGDAEWLSKLRVISQRKLRGWRLAASVGAAVGCLVFAATAAVTALLPRSYLGAVRLAIQPVATEPQDGIIPFDPYFVQTEFEKIRSTRVLLKVVEQLRLDEHWPGMAEQPGACAAQLQRHLEIQQVRSTSIVEIRYYSVDPGEAATIANAIAKAYQTITPARVEIIALAQPPTSPGRPNVPLNLLLGALAGAVSGIGFAAGVLVIRTPAVRTNLA